MALWSICEIHGPTRGSICHALTEQDGHYSRLDLALATVGSDGHWPHLTAFWRADDTHELGVWADAGWDDGFDETAVHSGNAGLYRSISGGIDRSHAAYLVERVTTTTPAGLAALSGPTAMFADVFAPWQGIALWGAADLGELRESEPTIGFFSDHDVRNSVGWWAVVPPDRELV